MNYAKLISETAIDRNPPRSAVIGACLACIFALAACHGCATDPETGDVTIRVPARAVEAATNALAKAAAERRKEQTSIDAPVPAGEGEAGAEGHAHPCEEPEAAGTEGSFNAAWRYGGFDGSRAKEDSACRIKSVSMSDKGVEFKFSGSWWGATHDNPTMRCCAFFKSGDKWVGGFWEWGSPDRTYRAFTNIDDGYNGWSGSDFHAAKEYAFLICSKDGKKRSNVVYVGGAK